MFGQQGAQMRARALHAHLECRHPDARERRDFVVAQLFGKSEDHGLALSRSQLGERVKQLATTFSRRALTVIGRCVLVQFGVEPCIALFSRRPRAALIDHDSQHPRAKLVALAIAAQVSVRPNERFLHHILGIVAITQNMGGDSKASFMVPVYQTRKHLDIARQNGADKFGVGAGIGSRFVAGSR